MNEITYEQLQESKRQLIEYANSGFRRVSYMVDGYNKKLRIAEDDYLKLNNKQIIHIVYLHDSIDHIVYSDVVYPIYWSQQKMMEWIVSNLRLAKADFIRKH